MPAQKRKRASSPPSSTEATDTLSIFATQLKEHANKPSLWDLPPEVRNLIYEAVVDLSKAVLSRNTAKKGLQSSSTLYRVNKQVREEFTYVTLLTANVHTTVRDFNFSHVIAFLNRLSDIELQSLCIDLPDSRRIHIELFFSPQTPNYPQLLRWIRRAGHPTKKGTDIDFQYHAVRDAYVLGQGVVTSMWRTGKKGGTLVREDGEARKIDGALPARGGALRR